jgi:exodeoxyribonuclease V alpha subunit
MKYGFLKQRLDQGDLTHLDVYFAEFMAELSATDDAQLVNVLANLAHAQSQQHSCLDISSRTDLIAKLVSLDTVTTIVASERGEANTPLVLVKARDDLVLLYLQRYYQYETEIVRQLAARNQQTETSTAFLPMLDELFPASSDADVEATTDWQKVAAFQALTRQLTIITGGPGTGKTSTVVKILAAYLSHSNEENSKQNSNDENRAKPPKIRLAAPTGKAASRLAQSIEGAINQLPENLRAGIPTDVSTLHRLIGTRGDGRPNRHHRGNPLNVDLLILDEVSMIDVVMFNNVLQALPPHASLILLGDPKQLPSVDNGSVLSDLCEIQTGYSQDESSRINKALATNITPVNKPNELSNAYCELKRSYRFSDIEGIGALAKSVRLGEIPDQQSNDQIHFVTAFSEVTIITSMLDGYASYLSCLTDSSNHQQILTAFDRYQMLTPMREGDFSVHALNQLIMDKLNPSGSLFYHGKPIIISRNDYNLKLFNGDVGICLKSDDDNYVVIFKDEGDNVKTYLASRLPAHEACYAMTVHKSQGSEFNHVGVVIPPSDQRQREELLSRELIYTAITRAKSFVTLFSTKKSLATAIERRNHRLTGLAEFIKPQV